MVGNSNIFDSFEKTAYRIEMQPMYDVSSEQTNFSRFINGEELDPKDNKEWIGSLKEWRNQGKQIKRVRVISPELSLYEKYEFNCYHKNWEAGEEVNVITYEEYKKLSCEHLEGDFWIFDNKLVVKLIYNNEYKFTNFEIIEDKLLVNEYSKLFKNVYENAFWTYKDVLKQMRHCPISINLKMQDK